MSLDELREDIKRNRAEAGRLDPAVRDHLKNTLWPFMEAVVEVLEEIDDAVGELVERQEDYLQPETAAIFATMVQTSLELSKELRTRGAGDELLAKKLDAHDALCAQVMTMLGEITMVPEEGAEEGAAEDDEGEAGNA